MENKKYDRKNRKSTDGRSYNSDGKKSFRQGGARQGAPKQGGFSRYDRHDSRPQSRYSGKPRFDDEPREATISEAEQERLQQLIAGRNPVTEAIKSGVVLDKVFVNAEAGGSIGNIIRLAKEKGILVKEVNEQKLSAMCGGASHQGIIAVGACAEYVSVSDILDIAKEKGEDPFVIICDEVEDPHNLGAIIRTAETVGAHGIIIPKRRSASLNHTVYKTSAGAASWLPVARVANLASAIDELKENGVWIYGTDGSGEDYRGVDLTGPMGLVIGSEGFGMGKLIMSKCDFLLRLPMKGKITSLNASVAGGIFMYEILRQREIKTK